MPAERIGSRWLRPVLWAAVILVGTSWPSISVGPDDLFGMDKVIHFGMYAVLAVLVMRALGSQTSFGVAAVAFVLLSAFGAADEWHQGFIDGRSASLYDWIADTLGTAVGILVARIVPAVPGGHRASHPPSTP